MVAEGYKETEIGVIPVEWGIVKLKDTDLTIIDGDRGNNYPKSNDFTDEGYCLFLSAKNITKNGFRLYEKQFISEEKDNLLRKGKLKDLDIIITTRGSVGHIAFNKNIKYENIRINSGMVILRNPYKEINQNYVYKLFSSSVIQRQIEKIAFGSAQPQLTVKEINNLKIPLPPLKEQEKIADILSTADEKIDTIASQIQKAQTLKKGLLQKLLSEGIGHSEFKDSELGKIPDSWEVVKLNDLSKITMGQSPKSDTYNTENIGIPLIQGNADCKNRKTIPRTYTTVLTKECFVGDIIMTVRAPVGAISKSLHNACIGRGVCSIRPNKDNEYIYHCLVAYEDNWDKLSQGSTFTAVSGSDIKNLKFPLPPLKEQKQIADILSTADEKLEVLRAKKQKYETLKKSLLQKLLSGEVRV